MEICRFYCRSYYTHDLYTYRYSYIALCPPHSCKSLKYAETKFDSCVSLTVSAIDAVSRGSAWHCHTRASRARSRGGGSSCLILDLFRGLETQVAGEVQGGISGHGNDPKVENFAIFGQNLTCFAGKCVRLSSANSTRAIIASVESGRSTGREPCD